MRYEFEELPLLAATGNMVRVEAMLLATGYAEVDAIGNGFFIREVYLENTKYRGRTKIGEGFEYIDPKHPVHALIVKALERDWSDDIVDQLIEAEELRRPRSDRDEHSLGASQLGVGAAA